MPLTKRPVPSSNQTPPHSTIFSPISTPLPPRENSGWRELGKRHFFFLFFDEIRPHA